MSFLRTFAARCATVVWLLVIPIMYSGGEATASEPLPATSSDVVPIEWSQFDKQVAGNPRLEQATRLLLNSTRYNLAWIDREFDLDEKHDAYILTRFDEHGVRPACSAAYGMGVVLKTGIYDADEIGLSKSEAQLRTLRLIRGIVRAHAANNLQANTWGAKGPSSDPAQRWQTPLWAALGGMGGWLMWEHLDPATQQMLVKMLERESEPFFAPNYRVPYWNGQGGDTKAEENAWNSMPLALMAAMKPDHPHAAQWKNRCSELIVSAYATREDWQANETIVDGRPVKAWLNGFNAEPGGVIINHDFIHPDYMAAISMNFWALTTQSLAGKPAPEAWDFNAPLVYRAFVLKSWDSPPFQPPGGTIYVPGKANIYYPKGNDWSYHDLTLYYLMDVYADLFHWHPAAANWLDLRAGAMLAMQRRHADGRMFASGEYDSYPGCEQLAFWCLADAFLPQWLDARGALSKKANWLQSVPGE